MYFSRWGFKKILWPRDINFLLPPAGYLGLSHDACELIVAIDESSLSVYSHTLQAPYCTAEIFAVHKADDPLFCRSSGSYVKVSHSLLLPPFTSTSNAMLTCAFE